MASALVLATAASSTAYSASTTAASAKSTALTASASAHWASLSAAALSCSAFLLSDALSDVLDVLIPAALQLVPMSFGLLRRVLGNGAELGGMIVGDFARVLGLAWSLALSSAAAAWMWLSDCCTWCLSSLKRSDADIFTRSSLPCGVAGGMESRHPASVFRPSFAPVIALGKSLVSMPSDAEPGGTSVRGRRGGCP